MGVRMSTCNDVLYVESGYPPLGDLIKHRQQKFFRGMWNDRNNMVDDPLIHVMKVVFTTRIPTSKYIENLISGENKSIEEAMSALKLKITQSTSSRRIVYRSMNPDFYVHDVYTRKTEIPEIHRMSFTRFRVSGHCLAVETGRWNRRGRGRLPLEERLCPCGDIQTERHVVESCPMTQDVRAVYSITTLEQLFLVTNNPSSLCEAIHNILSIFK